MDEQLVYVHQSTTFRYITYSLRYTFLECDDLVQKALIIGWTFGILCNGSILFGVTQKNISLAWSVAYASLSRTAWGFGIAWLTIACTTNNGGK